MQQINICPDGDGPLTASEFLKGARIRKKLIASHNIGAAQIVINDKVQDITNKGKLSNNNGINILSASPVLDIPKCEFLVGEQINIDLTKFTYGVNIGFMDKYIIIGKLPEGLSLSGNIIKGIVKESGNYESCVIANDKNGLQSNICNFTINILKSDNTIT